jgi:hypothetical protein
MVSQPQSKLFAVVHICGRQFKVTPNDLVVVSRLQADIGESIFLEKVCESLVRLAAQFYTYVLELTHMYVFMYASSQVHVHTYVHT